MTDDPGKSSTISRRRELLEEVLIERSKAVAALPVEEQEPPASSPLWSLGAHRITGWWVGDRVRRAVALDLAVLALAWLERIDEEARARGASPGA